jgi:hypothetical protein
LPLYVVRSRDAPLPHPHNALVERMEFIENAFRDTGMEAEEWLDEQTSP